MKIIIVIKKKYNKIERNEIKLNYTDRNNIVN